MLELSGNGLPLMLRRQLSIPPAAAKAFFRDLRAFHKAIDQLAGDEIAAKQAWLLQQHLPAGARIRLSDMKELFHAMKDQA